MDVARNGGRVRLFRNVAAITMDLNNVESLVLRALGGADVITSTSASTAPRCSSVASCRG